VADLPAIVAAFGHVLHQAGVPVTPERSARFARAVVLAEPATLTELAALGRTTLLSSHEQIEVFDRVFAQVFRGIVDYAEFRSDSAEAPPPSSSLPQDDAPPTGSDDRDGSTEVRPGGSSDAGGSDDEDEDDDDRETVLAAWSTEERLGHKNFADCTPDELALITALVAQLPFVAPLRTARRQRKHASGKTLDVRATLRRSHRTSGDPVHRVHRKATTRPRRVVLLADVSGSMEPYSRVYLHLMRGAVKALGSEAFVFATRLTRLTRQLSLTHPDIAYRKAAEAAPDWSGGTRIGSALKSFIDDYGRRGLARGAVVVIVSDGWEVGDPELVRRSMEQLSRLAFRVIWVNPRKAARGYQPLVGGMAAALPYVDTFVSGHSLRALAEVMSAIREAQVAGRRVAAPVRLPSFPEVAELVTDPADGSARRNIFPTGTLLSGGL
jgi:uncharacterized protein